MNIKMIEKLTQSKDITYLEILEFKANFHKSSLYHFQIVIDEDFRFKIIDFLPEFKRIFIPLILLESLTQITVLLINDKNE